MSWLDDLMNMFSKKKAGEKVPGRKKKPPRPPVKKLVTPGLFRNAASIKVANVAKKIKPKILTPVRFVDLDLIGPDTVTFKPKPSGAVLSPASYMGVQVFGGTGTDSFFSPGLGQFKRGSVRAALHSDIDAFLIPKIKKTLRPDRLVDFDDFGGEEQEDAIGHPTASHPGGAGPTHVLGASAVSDIDVHFSDNVHSDVSYSSDGEYTWGSIWCG